MDAATQHGAGLARWVRADTKALLGIWRDLLGLSEIADSDDFFRIGGDSLAAAKMVLRVREELGVTATLQEVFELPTFAQFEARIRERYEASTQQRLPPAMVRADRYRPALASLGQEHLLLLNEEPENAMLAGFFIHVAFRVQGPIDVERLRAALHVLALRHEPLRTTFYWDRPHLYQCVRANPDIDFHYVVVDSGPDSVADVRRRIHREATRPLNRLDGRLLSCHLYCLAPETHVLLIVIDHFVCDGHSLDMLLAELGQAYAGLAVTSDFAFDEPDWQFVDWSQQQRRTLSGAEMLAVLTYWRTRLGPDPRVVSTPLPAYIPSRDARPGRLQVEVGRRATADIRARASRENVTLFALVLGGLMMTLRKETGRDSVCVKTSLANRTVPGSERVFGAIAHDVYLNVQVSPTDSLSTVAHQVRTAVAEANRYGDIPDIVLWDRLWPGSHEHLHDEQAIYFSLGPQWGASLELAGAQTRTFATDPGPPMPGIEYAVFDRGDALEVVVSHKVEHYPPDYLRELVEASIAVLTAGE